MNSHQLVEMTRHVRVLVRPMVGAAVAGVLTVTAWGYYAWRYRRATCPSGGVDYFDGKHDTYFGCTWVGGGWEDGHLWQDRASLALLGLLAILIVTFFVSSWHLSAARHRLLHAARGRRRPQD